MSNKLTDILNVNPIEPKKEILFPINSDNLDDIELATSNIKDLIFKGTGSLDDLMDVAKRSEHPRAYEVLANLLNTLVNANKELVGIRLKEMGTRVNNDNRQINNNLFVGSTADLLKLVKPHKMEEAIIDGEMEED